MDVVRTQTVRERARKSTLRTQRVLCAIWRKFNYAERFNYVDRTERQKTTTINGIGTSSWSWWLYKKRHADTTHNIESSRVGD